MLISAGLLAVAAAVSFALIRVPGTATAEPPGPDPAASVGGERLAVERYHYCGVTAPPAHPADARR
jgi:hypothetical protein